MSTCLVPSSCHSRAIIPCVFGFASEHPGHSTVRCRHLDWTCGPVFSSFRGTVQLFLRGDCGAVMEYLFVTLCCECAPILCSICFLAYPSREALVPACPRRLVAISRMGKRPRDVESQIAQANKRNCLRPLAARLDAGVPCAPSAQHDRRKSAVFTVGAPSHPRPKRTIPQPFNLSKRSAWREVCCHVARVEVMVA